MKKLGFVSKVVSLAVVFAMTTAFGMSLKEVNKASKDELVKIKGIGDKKADAIIKYRKKSPFKSYEDIEAVKGVGPALVKNIKNDIHKKEPTKKSKKSTDKKSSSKKSEKKKSDK